MIFQVRVDRSELIVIQPGLAIILQMKHSTYSPGPVHSTYLPGPVHSTYLLGSVQVSESTMFTALHAHDVTQLEVCNPCTPMIT